MHGVQSQLHFGPHYQAIQKQQVVLSKFLQQTLNLDFEAELGTLEPDTDKPRAYYDFFSGCFSILLQKVFQRTIDLPTKQSRVKN